MHPNFAFEIEMCKNGAGNLIQFVIRYHRAINCVSESLSYLEMISD